jgi:hypothetical protein
VRDLDRVAHDIDASSVTVRAEATDAVSAERSFSDETVDAGEPVTVTIEIANFQLGMAVVETLPAGFSYVSGSISGGTVVVVGQDLQIIPDRGEFSYDVTASSTPGSHSFSGSVRDDNNGEIEKPGMLQAIRDYQFGQGDASISKDDVLAVIRMFQFP